MIKQIEFNDEELIKALEKGFSLPKGSITFYYISSFFRNRHTIRYMFKEEKTEGKNDN
jgi:hypothetical protein